MSYVRTVLEEWFRLDLRSKVERAENVDCELRKYGKEETFYLFQVKQARQKG